MILVVVAVLDLEIILHSNNYGIVLSEFQTFPMPFVEKGDSDESENSNLLGDFDP